MPNMWILWLVLFIAFLIVEFETIALISIWFAAGSLVAMILALSGASETVQIVVMLVVSIVLLVTFLLLRKKLGIVPGRAQATNADRLLGKTGEVILTVNPVENVGQVQVNGQIWSARTDLDQNIEKGTIVRIVELRGVKLVVIPDKETIR